MQLFDNPKSADKKRQTLEGEDSLLNPMKKPKRDSRQGPMISNTSFPVPENLKTENIKKFKDEKEKYQIFVKKPKPGPNDLNLDDIFGDDVEVSKFSEIDKIQKL